MAMAHASRNPYSFPSLQGDNDFKGKLAPETICYPVPTHLAQRQQPWQRISGHHTLSSARREVYHFDPSAPNDDLDFVLKTTYNQHKELLKHKNEVVFQPETFCENHGRVLKNRVKALPVKKLPLNHPLVITSHKRREDFNSVKTAIGDYYMHWSRQGYSHRTHIGGYYLL